MTDELSSGNEPRAVDPDAATGALAALLTEVFGASSVADDESRPVDELVDELVARGWTRAGAAPVLVAAAGVVDGIRGPAAPTVVVIRHEDPTAQRAWPGWDEGVVDAGYLPCARAGRWTWYVAQDRAGVLGPRLGELRTDAVLLADVVAWRTAALTRWATRADEEAGRANKELRAELDLTKSRLAAIETSLAWKMGRGLRLVVPGRLVRTLRR